MMRASLLVAAAALLITTTVTAARLGPGSRALQQVVADPVEPTLAEEFTAWFGGNVTVAVHMDECNPLGAQAWSSPRCSLVVNASAPAIPVPRAEGAQGAAWVTYIDFEHADNLTSGLAFDTFTYDISLDAPAAADNAILGVLFATVNASGAITCYHSLFKGEVESCTEFVLSELPLDNGAVAVDPMAPLNASVVKGGAEVVGLQGNLSSSTAGESVVFLSEDGLKMAAAEKEFDFVFLIIASGGFTINSAGFTEPGLHLQASSTNTTVTPTGDSPSSPSNPVM